MDDALKKQIADIVTRSTFEVSSVRINKIMRAIAARDEARDAAIRIEAKIEYAEYIVSNKPTYAWHTHELPLLKEQLEIERRESDLGRRKDKENE